MSQSRTKNSIRNTRWSVLQLVVATLLSFVTRTFFVRFLGDFYLGLNSFFLNVLNILGLVELGIGAAIIFSLYKPIAENNIEKINALIRLFKRVYLIISIVIVAVGAALMPFLPRLIQDDIPNLLSFFIFYAVFLASSVVSYLFMHRRILFLVYQRNDVTQKIRLLQILLLNGAKILVIVVFRSFMLVAIVTLATVFLDNLLVFIYSKKYYKNITGKKGVPLTAPEKKWIKDYTLAMILHKIGGIVVLGIDNILIAAFLGLVVAGHFSNYLMLVVAANALIITIIGAFRGSVGNLIAERTPEEAHKIYKRLNFLLSFGVTFISVSLFVLFQPFIGIWVGTERQLDFVVVVLICIVFYLTSMRQVNLLFIDCAGLMRKCAMNPVLEVPVKLVASILLGMSLGLAGILLGTVISTMTTVFWLEPIVLHKEYFKKEKVRGYFGGFVWSSFIAFAVGLTVFFVLSFIPVGGIGWFVLKAGVAFALTSGLLILVNIKNPHFRYFMGLFKRMLFRRKKVIADTDVDLTVVEKENLVVNEDSVDLVASEKEDLVVKE